MANTPLLAAGMVYLSETFNNSETMKANYYIW
jgi:hypothetical protein